MAGFNNRPLTRCRTDLARIVLHFHDSKEHATESWRPQDGDVLVSNPTATVEHEICIVPRSPHITRANHDRAVTEGRLLAEQLKVDVWLTEDNCHFLRIGSYRQ